MQAYFENLNSQLESEGTIVVAEEQLPFNSQEWKNLSGALDNLNYEDIYEGDTSESTSVKVFRIKKEKDDTIYDSQLMEAINSPLIRKYISNILGVDDYIIERSQCHIYEEGDFVSKHQDNASCRDFKYAFMILLDSEYEGGEFCVYNPYRDEPYIYRPVGNSLILTKCDLEHEVKEVTKGRRKVIVSFIKFPSPTIH